jgi:hypothetical protein
MCVCACSWSRACPGLEMSSVELTVHVERICSILYVQHVSRSGEHVIWGGSGDPTRYHIKGKIVSDRAACRS